MDEKQYLREDFDPKSLKVAQLRGILNEYDISYQSNAKKNDLLKLFNDEVKPNVPKYRHEYEQSVKNSNDVGIINTATDRPVRRSKKSTSIDPETTDSTNERKPRIASESAQTSDMSGFESDTAAVVMESKKTKRKTKNPRIASESAQTSDMSGFESDTAAVTMESKKTKRKTKKPKKSEREKEAVADAASSTNSPQTDIKTKAKHGVKNETDKVTNDTSANDDKDDTMDECKPEIKAEGSFTNENVFQSPPNSSGVKKDKSTSNYNSPVLSKKRHRENEEEGTPAVKRKPKSPIAKLPESPSIGLGTSKFASHKKGHLFDDNESSDSETDIFSKSIINQVKSPKLSKIKKPSSRKSTPIKVDKQTPTKKGSNEKKLASQEEIEQTPSKLAADMKDISSSVKSSDKKSNSSKGSAKNNNTVLSDNSFLSFTEEQDDFDKQRSKIIKNEENAPSLSGGVEALTSADLASQLGITIQGLPPKDFKLCDDSFSGIKSDTPSKKLSPRPREFKKVTHPNLDILSDDEDGEGDNLDKVQKGIEKEIEKLNDIVQKENTPSIKKPSLFSVISFIGLWLIILSVGLSGYWYREQTYLIGYCGQEIKQSTIPPSSDLSNWLVQAGSYLDNNFKPRCVKCPAHARCYPYLEIGCYEDFVEYRPWYFDILPIINPNLKKCIPDTKKAEKLEIMIDVSLDLLRSKNANKNCGKIPSDNFEAGLSVEELHDLLLLMKAPYITKEEFEELWQRSLIELEKEPEIITGFKVGDIFSTINSNDTRKEEKENKIFRSTSLSNLSLKCHIQNTIIKSMIEYKSVIFAFIGIFLCMILLKYRYEQFKLERLKIETIYSEVLKKLRKQNKVSKSSNYKVPSYIGSTQLRDLILTNETNLTRKLTLWNKISNKIENNSNIRYHLIENHGEIMKVWEWITDMEIHD